MDSSFRGLAGTKAASAPEVSCKRPEEASEPSRDVASFGGIPNWLARDEAAGGRSPRWKHIPMAVIRRKAANSRPFWWIESA